MQNIWVSRYTDAPPVPPELPDWANRLEISTFLAELLWKRGLNNLEDMNLFLNPGLKHLAALEEWPGLTEAASIIADAALSGKKIAVWGDYDVDGITSTALVVDFFRQHNITIRPHIPSRMEQGYGLNIDDLKMLADEGVNLIITVDCGICDVDEVDAARELGIDIIVSDHHLPAEKLPKALAVCAPTIADCPCRHLAGVGVAFMLMAGVNSQFAQRGKQKADIRPLLDLVALGTLADVSNLAGQNRILVKNGLILLSEGRRPGIAALKNICNYAPNASMGAGQVVFTMAPRINAAGRMGKSEIALELMLTHDRDEANQLAQQLETMNIERRSEEDIILKEAREQAEAYVKSGHMGLVLYGANWHMGVIGIVASRIVEEFQRPTIILCDSSAGKAKGSGRSVDGFDLHSALGECSDLFLGFGGHKMAAGLSISHENIAGFRLKFHHIAAKEIGDTPPPMKIKTDGELELEQTVSFILLKELELLQPFGHGNAEPVFISPPLLVKELRVRPGLAILDVQDEKSGITIKAKLWRPRTEIKPDSRGKRIRLAFSPRIDRYNGAATIEMRVKDWFWALEE